ncbi:hypothetical protein ITG09_10815 [Vibrio cyclitrophicus]|nr:hypothetical protein [Vibrio cyclitrophicus]UPR51199.1 hypothetical protein ITG09_10815 [Vibrio cyclitrophicus]
MSNPFLMFVPKRKTKQLENVSHTNVLGQVDASNAALIATIFDPWFFTTSTDLLSNFQSRRALYGT